jgi:hypothetical protein
VAFLTRALKGPTLRAAVPRLADRAREQSWSHEEFLIACLQRKVAARESDGGEGRIRAARFPARKSLEKFEFDHARGLKRELIAHLGTLDFVRSEVVSRRPRRLSRTKHVCQRVGQRHRIRRSCSFTQAVRPPGPPSGRATRVFRDFTS